LDLWTLPNILTLARVPLVLPGAYLLWRGEEVPLAVVFLVAAALTDALDGFLARRLGRITEIGKKLDPVADKVAIALVGFVLAMKYGIPWWLFGVVVVRDAAIVAAAAFVIKARGKVPSSDNAGKAAASAMVVYGVAAVLAPAAAVTEVLLYVVLALVIMSSASYLKTLFRVMGERKLA
jgi:CDP-diacylglycerol--glycerol-3-phosphate 3-phosphatidyltransferase